METVKRAIRKRGIGLIVFGTILFLGMGFIALAAAMVGDAVGMMVFALIMLCLGVLFIVLGIKDCSIHASGLIKRNPDLLEQGEELYNNIVYQDKYIVYSNKHVASKRSPTSIAAFDEVIGMYERKTTYAIFITVQKELIIVTKRDEIPISVFSGKKMDDLANLIYEHCPQARIGASAENMAYFKEQHKAYKEQLKAMRR